jgi:hypothetical protein
MTKLPFTICSGAALGAWKSRFNGVYMPAEAASKLGEKHAENSR